MNCEGIVGGGRGERGTHGADSEVSSVHPDTCSQLTSSVTCAGPQLCYSDPCPPAPLPHASGQLPLRGPVFFSVSLSPAFVSCWKPQLAFPCLPPPTTYFLLGSWYRPRARTQSQLPSALTTHQSCHLQWNARGALGTLDPRPFSKWDLKVGMAHGKGAPQLNPGLDKGAPRLLSSPPSPLYLLALTLVEAARRTWTMTRRPTPWCLPNESGPDGGTAQSTVCIPPFEPLPAAAFSRLPPFFTLFPELRICLAQPLACPPHIPPSLHWAWHGPSCLPPLQQPGSMELQRGSGGGSRVATTVHPPL